MVGTSGPFGLFTQVAFLVCLQLSDMLLGAPTLENSKPKKQFPWCYTLITGTPSLDALVCYTDDNGLPKVGLASAKHKDAQPACVLSVCAHVHEWPRKRAYCYFFLCSKNDAQELFIALQHLLQEQLRFRKNAIEDNTHESWIEHTDAPKVNAHSEWQESEKSNISNAVDGDEFTDRFVPCQTFQTIVARETIARVLINGIIVHVTLANILDGFVAWQGNEPAGELVSIDSIKNS